MQKMSALQLLCKMSLDESCQDQQEELKILKSTYGKKLRDLRKNKQQQKWQPLDIVVTLTSKKIMSGPVEVDLHVVCGDNYPQEVPNIFLQNTKGLPHQNLFNYSSELENLAQQLKGKVMIFEICQHLQKLLREHDEPQERHPDQLAEKQIKGNKEEQIVQDKTSKQEVLGKENRNHRESRLSLESDAVLSQPVPTSLNEKISSHSRRKCLSTSESSKSFMSTLKGIEILHFENNKGERKIRLGECLRCSTKGTAVYVGVDVITGELLAITEWTLRCRPIVDQSNDDMSSLQYLMKQVVCIEQELNHLLKINHPNLVRYLNMKYLQTKDNIVIYILQEFVVGTTCSFFLMQNIPVDIDMLRHLAVGILSALEYLHKKNVVHKDLRDSSVYIDRSGIVKLSDYSLNKRLSDVHRASCLAELEHDFPTIQGRGGKKADIFRFGILMSSLLKGTYVEEIDAEVDSSMQPDLRDFINKCLLSNERDRWSAQQLMQHCFIKTPLKLGLAPSGLDSNQIQNRYKLRQERDTDVQFYLPAFGGQSRIQNEFEVLEWLGQGALGEVLKVRNKLDGRVYALKRIKLNPKNKQLKRKITREVKLLSRLNHENIVRYYNSWIESATIEDLSLHSKFTACIKSSSNLANVEKTLSIQDHSIIANSEKLAPPMHNVEWNISYESRASTALSVNGEENNSDQSSDSDDLSDEEWSILNIRTRSDSSDSRETQRDSISPTSESTRNFQKLVGEKNKNETKNKDTQVNEIQFLYIQMEFCEKSTLKAAIDSGLFEEEERIWRLFREIVKGLAHIHQKGMIHRDLKPVNIFLDSNDHVKIGDFGLATMSISSIYTQTLETEKENQISDKGINYEIDDVSSMSGQVCTALYAAPDLSAQDVRAIYNQKVDIYSLGIIFFEMCHKPFETIAERVKVLLNLRSTDIILPPEMSERTMTNKVHLLRWLLNHDPSQRPTSQELSASEYLPPVQLKEAELEKMICHALTNPKSEAHNYLMACCFSQKATISEDLRYDMSLPACDTPNSILPKIRIFQESIKSKVVKIFKKHGGICVTTPLLIPKCDQLHSLTDTCVQLMTRTGSVVSIPHDLRRPFARYIAWNNISCIRGYAIERVYKEKKICNSHPSELYECAFDIVSPVANKLMSEAELIFIAWEICNEIPELQDQNFTVRINHTSLLQAILMDCGIEREKYEDIYSILCDACDGKYTLFQVQTRLISLCLTDQAMETLSSLFKTESSVIKITNDLKTITKKKGDAAALAKEGLMEIGTVVSNAQALGVKWPIMVVPLLVQNTQQYSGVIYQIAREIKGRRRRGGQDVIASGGRYDKMLSTFKELLERTGRECKETKQYGVGISISLDKLVRAASEFSEDFYRDVKYAIDVAICCVDGLPRRDNELLLVMRELRPLGLKVICLDFGTSEELREYCREYKIRYVSILRSGEIGKLRIETWEKDRFQECQINIQDVAEYFQRQQESIVPVVLNRSGSKINDNMELTALTNTPANVNINFIIFDKDKLSGSSKRSYKNSILAKISSDLQRISHKVPVEVFAVFLETPIVRGIINFLDFLEEEQVMLKNIQQLTEEYPRYKKYIKQIFDELRKKGDVGSDKIRPALILYSLSTNQYATLV